ncbi:Glycosyl transferase, group 1 [Chitinispirillum alkaliphilum]|nr:Glycosyl transferase, group 1 [Chitinispirillum alkaliphilum]
MKILIIPSWYSVESDCVKGIFFDDQARALLEQGNKVGVIWVEVKSLRKSSFTHVFRSISKTEAALKIKGSIPVYRLSSPNLFPGITNGFLMTVVMQGKRIYREYCRAWGKPDIIHAHSVLYGGVLGVELGKMDNVPVVLTEHSTSFDRGALKSNELEIANKTFLSCRKLISVSRHFAERLQARFPETRGKWCCIPNLVDEAFFKTDLKVKKDKNRFRIINVGLMTEKKGQRDLILAFLKVAKLYPKLQLELCGDGPQRKCLEMLVIANGAQDKISFTGMLSRREIVKKMSQSNVLVVSSYHETFGVVVAEALACGIPVIATKSGGPEEIVRKEDGILVSAGNVEELSCAMERIYKNYSDYKPSEIRGSCLSRYGSSSVIEKIDKAYQEALGPVFGENDG